MQTFTDVLAGRLGTDAGRPLVTYYDLATGERTELSVTTYANWVAKTASLFDEECSLERGDRLLVDLPAHWLGPVVLGAAWTVGLQVLWPGRDGVPAGVAGVVCGPTGLPRYADAAGEVEVVASALLPFGVRFPEPVPPGVHDLGVEVWSQPDAFSPWDPPLPDDAAAPGMRQRDLWAAPASAAVPAEGGVRLLCTGNPASADGLGAFTGTLARGGSLVLVVNASADQARAVAEAERTTSSA